MPLYEVILTRGTSRLSRTQRSAGEAREAAEAMIEQCFIRGWWSEGVDEWREAMAGAMRSLRGIDFTKCSSRPVVDALLIVVAPPA